MRTHSEARANVDVIYYELEYDVLSPNLSRGDERKSDRNSVSV
jgi:hypothetical protein